jgi:hypothetical protein
VKTAYTMYILAVLCTLYSMFITVASGVIAEVHVNIKSLLKGDAAESGRKLLTIIKDGCP